MSEADTALHSATAGALAAGSELLNALFSYIVPLVMVVVGFFLGTHVGISGLVAHIIVSTLGSSISDTAVIWISDLVAGTIWAAVAALIWHMGSGKSSGKWPITMWIGRALGGLFAGASLSEFGSLVQGKVNYGMLTNAADSLSVPNKGA